MSLFNRNQVPKERKPFAFIWKIMQCGYISKLNRLHLQHDKIQLEENCVKYHIALISEGFPAGALSHIDLMPNCCITLLLPSDRDQAFCPRTQLPAATLYPSPSYLLSALSETAQQIPVMFLDQQSKRSTSSSRLLMAFKRKSSRNTMGKTGGAAKCLLFSYKIVNIFFVWKILETGCLVQLSPLASLEHLVLQIHSKGQIHRRQL